MKTKTILTSIVAFILGIYMFLQSANVISSSNSENIQRAVSFIKEYTQNNRATKTSSEEEPVENSSKSIGDKYLSFNISNLNEMCDFQLEKDAYMSCFSKKYKIPLLVAYKLEKAKVLKTLKRPSGFHPDPAVPARYQAKDSNYRMSSRERKAMGGGYHRGHMMENASADWSKRAQQQTFLFTNIVPQFGKFNTGAWKQLEDYTRKLTYKYRNVSIISGAIPGNKSLRGGITIPSHMYKIIYIPSIKKTEVYLYPNDNTVRSSQFKSDKYKSSIKEIESLTGFKFE